MLDECGGRMNDEQGWGTHKGCPCGRGGSERRGGFMAKGWASAGLCGADYAF